MIVKLKENYQIKIPASIIRTMGLHLGDQLDVSVRGDTICLLPLVTYPKKYLKELKDEANQLDKNIVNGSVKACETQEELFEELEKVS